MAEALDAGHAKVWLEGEKLEGGWTLQRTRRRPEAAVAADQAPRRGRRRPAQPAEHPARVGQERTHDRAGRARGGDERGRRVSDAARRAERRRARARRARRPRRPRAGAMKAVLTDARFSDPDWIFERKLDGIRCIAIRSGQARAAALAQRPVARRRATPSSSTRSRPRRATGSRSTARSSRSTARRRASPASPSAAHRDVPVFLYVFDIVWLDGPRRPRRCRCAPASGCCATRCASRTACG